MKKFAIGYTQGAFDMFHVGHLNLLKNAKQQCKKLIVGINTDSLIYNYKNKHTIISEQDRLEIVKAIKYVDDVMLVDTLDKCEVWNKIKFDAIFIGSDWKGNPRWLNTENELATKGAEVVYLTYTEGISSTMLRDQANNSISELKN